MGEVTFRSPGEEGSLPPARVRSRDFATSVAKAGGRAYLGTFSKGTCLFLCPTGLRAACRPEARFRPFRDGTSLQSGEQWWEVRLSARGSKDGQVPVPGTGTEQMT